MKTLNDIHYDLVNGYYLRTSPKLDILAYMSGDLYNQYNDYLMNKIFTNRDYEPATVFNETRYSEEYLSKIENSFNETGISIQGIDTKGLEDCYVVRFSCNYEFNNLQQAKKYFKDNIIPIFKEYGVLSFIDTPQLEVIISQYIKEHPDYLQKNNITEEQLLTLIHDDFCDEYVADNKDFSLYKYLSDKISGNYELDL